ncbi:NAD(P)-binding protein [Cystobasidium minutum MCA 4210]|uniref:NAD(P)-binding protein n=1 Tax=Cystobasidium minutum MCA 4210 TaxID=1397322 RepID=UPI0034CDF911|eukprot:jgi/Rhomi1/174101/fgenesh1_kg.7_\
MSLDISKLFDVKGKVAVITGGGSGLGTMMATALVQNGARVIIASRKEKQLKEVADKLTKEGPGSCEYIVANLGTKAACDQLGDEVKKRVDKIHILINNSGSTWGARYNEVPEKEGWDRVYDLNVKSLFYLTVALTPLLAKNANNIDPGRVINIASVAGLDPVAEGTSLGESDHGLWSYNTSKAAAIHLTKSLAATLSTKYITVNAICPGVYASKMTAYGLSRNKDHITNAYPMGRIGTPEDIAGLVLFLTSRAGAHVSGSFIESDGGALNSGKGYRKEPEKAKL